MSNFIYDMDKLNAAAEFAAGKALTNFDGHQSYFDRLTVFLDSYRNYLRTYNPTVIMYLESARMEMADEADKISREITPLEMTSITSQLGTLRETILHGVSEKALEDDLRVFHSMLEIAASRISGARTAGETEQPDLAKRLILAVDDRPEMLTTIKRILEDKYRVIGAISAQTALKALEVHSPALFLLDIEMPDVNGYELTKKIKSNDKFKETPIIFLTGNASREHVLKAKELGGNGYVLKPIDREKLLGKINLHLGGGSEL